MGSSTPRQVLLTCAGASVRRGHQVVVADVDLSLERGEVVALLGPNGAGKSTLLDALVGGVELSAGRIERAGRVAIALQSPELARRSVVANVELALSWWGVPREERRARALEALALFGVDELAGRPAAALSGGERRRVHLARALAVRPDVLLLDEPFAGLDAETRLGLLEDSVSMLRSPERATLVVVHDRAEAWALADRVLVMIGGSLAASGPPQELLAAPPSEAVARFLGYDGELVGEAERLLTRPANVKLDAAGPLSGRVVRAVPVEDGARIELQVDSAGWTGRLYVVSSLPSPRVGESVRFRLERAATLKLE